MVNLAGARKIAQNRKLAACPLDQSPKRDAIVMYVIRQYSHPASII